MAVAVPSSSETKKPARPMGLFAASLAGAVYVLGAAAVVLRLIPWVWDNGTSQAIAGATNEFVSVAAKLLLQMAAAVGLIWAGSKLASGPKAVGIRGGILLMIAVAFLGFFIVKGMSEQPRKEFSAGGILLMLVYVVVVFLLVQFFRTGRFAKWAVAVDRGGWLDTHTHKRTQGLRVRRLTILGILLVAGAGIWTLMNHNYLPANGEVTLPNGDKVSNRMGDWVIGGTVLQPDMKKALPEENRSRPRVDGGITILPDLQFTIPLLLIAATLWLAWRSVNYPTFADFLIATEAEINKVSWTSRKALIRDTIVVLTCLVLLTFFLFVVDMFWNALLSREWIGVLPSERDRNEQVKDQDAKPVTDW